MVKSLKMSTYIEAIVFLTIGLGFEKLACVHREWSARRMYRGIEVLRTDTQGRRRIGLCTCCRMEVCVEIRRETKSSENDPEMCVQSTGTSVSCPSTQIGLQCLKTTYLKKYLKNVKVQFVYHSTFFLLDQCFIRHIHCLSKWWVKAGVETNLLNYLLNCT